MCHPVPLGRGFDACHLVVVEALALLVVVRVDAPLLKVVEPLAVLLAEVELCSGYRRAPVRDTAHLTLEAQIRR